MQTTQTNQQLFDLPFGTNQITIKDSSLKCYKAIFDREDTKRLMRYLACYDIYPHFNNLYLIKCRDNMSMIIIIARESNRIWDTWDKALILNRINPLTQEQVINRYAIINNYAMAS